MADAASLDDVALLLLLARPVLTEIKGPPGFRDLSRKQPASSGALNEFLKQYAHPICCLELSQAALRLGKQPGVGEHMRRTPMQLGQVVGLQTSRL